MLVAEHQRDAVRVVVGQREAAHAERRDDALHERARGLRVEPLLAAHGLLRDDQRLEQAVAAIQLARRLSRFLIRS